MARILAVVLLALAAPFSGLAAPRAMAQSQIDARGIDLFDKGQAAHREGKLAEAIKLYDESIELDPEFWGSHYQRGVALLQLDRTVEAEKSLRRAVELEPEMAAAHAALGDLLARANRGEEAERELLKALEVDPTLAQVRLNYAALLWKRKAYAEAERELARLETENKATADSRYLLGEALLALGREGDAAASFDRALALDAAHVPTLRARGYMRAKAGDVPAAIADLEAAHRIAPSPETEAALADLRLRAASSGDPGVIATLRSRADANPRDLAARLALADALARAGRVDDAKRELVKYLEASPTEPATFDAAGDVLLDAAPLDAARLFVEAARLAPDNVEYRLKLGSALVRSGRYDAALPHLEHAAAKAPDRREAHAGLAASFYGLGRYAEAAREFGWLAEKDPASPGAQFFLGASLDRVGDCHGAVAAFRRFLATADATRDKSRIEEVNLRLPAIEREIERGGCKKGAGR